MTANASCPLVSIVTVCRNAEKTIERTLRGVEAQTYANLEYIVVDGNSDDRTLQYVKDCPAVTHWISEPDRGISDAFNKGIALARGEWVGIINADDWYEADAVAAAMCFAEEADVIHGPVQYWHANKPREVYYPNQERLRCEMTINHASVFVRRPIYEAVGGFDTAYAYAMDYELLLRIHAAGYRFQQINDNVLANVRYGGVSDKRWQHACIESMRAKNAHHPAVFCNAAYLVMQLTRGHLRRFLEKAGLHGVVRQARRFCAVMQKN